MKKLIFILLVIIMVITSNIGLAEARSGSRSSMSLYYSLTWPGQSVWVFVDDMREEDVDSIPNAKYSKVGDIYVGPSGAIYKLEPIAVEERDMLEATGLMIIGSWELQKKDEKSKEKQEREEMKK